MRIAPTMETSNISQNASVPIDFVDPTATGFYLAIVDDNTCMALTRVVVFYHVCPEMVVYRIRYPQTLAPTTNQPESVGGTCVDNASGELQGRNPQLSCIQGGKWGAILEGTGCQCNLGFIQIEETEECVSKYYSVCNSLCYIYMFILGYLQLVIHSICSYFSNIGCSSGEYVSPSNFTCLPCPSNTRDDLPGAVVCECLIGYYRAPQENADFGCTSKN